MVSKWLFDRKTLRQTPSQQDGVDYLTELRYRKEGAKFIQAAVKELGLTHDTMATGCVFFHRYYMFHSFEKFNRWVMAAACLFLAGKSEETPKMSKDIVRTAKQILSSDRFGHFGNTPIEEMLIYEKILLQTVKFDFNIAHPYKFILKFVKQFRGDQKKKSEVVQTTWNYCNESFCTPVALHYPPDVIAGALLTLSAEKCNFVIRLGPGIQTDELFDAPWWSHFIESSATETDMDEVQNIMRRLSEEKADLYEDEVDVTTSDSPPPAVMSPPISQAPPPPPRHSSKRHSEASEESYKRHRAEQHAKRGGPRTEPRQRTDEERRKEAEDKKKLRESRVGESGLDPQYEQYLRAKMGRERGEQPPPPPSEPAPDHARRSRGEGGVYDPLRGFV